MSIEALAKAGEPVAPPQGEPAVPVRQSVKADHLVCLECGQKFSMLKRHLRTDHQLTPEEYRQKWELPGSYPVVAPDYAKMRSGLAKKIGLGRLPGNTGREGNSARGSLTLARMPVFPSSELEYSQDCDVLHTIRLG